MSTLVLGRISSLIEYPTGYYNYPDGYPNRTDIQHYSTEIIRSDIRQFNLLYKPTLKSTLKLSSRISGQSGYPAQL